jgi:hypothetical protein
MSRKQERENKRIINVFKKKAVKDMEAWLDGKVITPTQTEILAFKDGYVLGFNRGVGQNN